MDLVVPCLNVAQGLPLFCDITVVSPITGNGGPRPGTSNAGGGLLRRAQTDNDNTYNVVITTGLGSLQCLGAEVYGRWGQQSIDLVPKLARERTRGLHPNIRKSIALGYQHRWWGILGVALQRSVARSVLNPYGDIPKTPLEPVCRVADVDII